MTKPQRKANKRLRMRREGYDKTHDDLIRTGKLAAAKGMKPPGSLNKHKSQSIKGAK